MRAISITVDLMFRLKVKIHTIDISNCTLYIVKFFIAFDVLFWPSFVYFQKEAAGLCINNLTINNLTNKYVK